MRADVESAKHARAAGFHPLPIDLAWRTLFATLSGTETSVTVLYGDAGKLRRLLAAPKPKLAEQAPVSVSSLTRWRAELTTIAAALIKIEPDELDPATNFSDYGFHSINITGLANEINRRYDLEITPATLFEYPSIDTLSGYLSTIKTDRTILPEEPVQYDQPKFAIEDISRRHEPIAIVGMSGRMPQADDLAAFWRNLCEERDCITEIPSTRWNWKEFAGEAVDGSNSTNIRWGAFLPQVDQFDPLFFGISPREAAVMDPQGRLLLECAWEAVEDSGTAPSDLAGSKTGVFVGVSTSDYSDLMRERASGMATHGSTGVAHCMLPNRISYLLDLHGPSEPIDTACSSSLVAIHRAVEAIRSGQCECALAGGVNVMLSPTLFISFAQAGMLSSDGVCRPFDAEANGYVRGEGAGIFFLKPLSSALRDGNPIHGLIRGTAVNHGGRATSLTAPNPNAQAALLLDAFEDAGINPWDLGYVEAHGTGTPLGDPIEINALRKAFQTWSAQHTSDNFHSRCLIGSVKSNVGHLEAAAGCAALFKVLWVLRHRYIPASLHVKQLNPQLQLDGSPFKIATQGQAWQPVSDRTGQTKPLLAGVSSFGFGGANAHVILEEYRFTSAEVEADRSQWIVVSARDEQRLRATAARLAAAMQRTDDPQSLSEIAYTLQVGRNAAQERLAFLADTVALAAATLADFSEGRPAKTPLFRGTARKSSADVSAISFEQVGQAWVNGQTVDWKRFQPSLLPRRVSLPSSAFLRERCWFTEQIEPRKQSEGSELPVYLERVWEPAARSKLGELNGPVLLIGGRPDEQEAFTRDLGSIITADNAEQAIKALIDTPPAAAVLIRPDLANWRLLAQAAACRPQASVRWLLVQDGGDIDPSFEMLDGIGRALITASPKSSFVSLRLNETEANALVIHCREELFAARSGLVEEVRSVNGIRFRRVSRLLPLAETPRFQFRAGAVYLISGGLGSLGVALARRMLQAGAKVTLLGRSVPSQAQRQLLEELRRANGSVTYHRADVSDPKQLAIVLRTIRGQWGPIQGIVHAAGALGKSALASKSEQEWNTVLQAKVEGTLALDAATTQDPLDFFVLYSSLSAITGDFGQGDYAAANRFLDAFALCRAERGPGRSLSVGWGLWQESGLSTTEQVKAWEQDTGLQALKTEAALDSLQMLLASQANHALVVAGNVSSLLGASPSPVLKPQDTLLPATPKEKGSIRSALEQYLLKRVGQHLQLAPETLLPTTPLQEYGLDSILLNQLVKLLAAEIAPIPKALLLEHDTIEAVCEHLINNHLPAVEAKFSTRSSAETAEVTLVSAAESWHSKAKLVEFDASSERIAIVGLAGRYPGARNLEDLWTNLAEGRSTIGGLPLSRWPDVNEGRDRHTRIGAFLDDVAGFDPVFFGISAVEARSMKPEERLLLELAVEAFETAGYST
ncbi:MAG: SDR family NAD(P)-dependent oxidoreductase, partial [Acidobacteriaceae bacterium]|nr:SDR family NAD(P)-dependent oxidoreductase [Acidobacteriaceae bacterium]